MGVAALLLVGAVAGFIVAEPAASREYQTVETVGSDSNAYAVDLSSEKRMRFVLEAEDAQDPSTEAPAAQFSVYDPQDRHFASFDLSGDGDDATVLADQAGSWVLFVTEADRGDIAVQVEGADEGADEVRSLEVDERSWEVARATGESVKRDLALRLDQRPAQAYLDVDGEVEDLDATAASEEGLVHAYEDVDGSQGVLGNGTQEVRPENLASGTYEIEAVAEHLNGTLTFVAESYERPDPQEIEEPEEPSDGDDDANASQPEAPSPDAEVASLTEGEAALVAQQGADEMVFETPEDARGKVYVYDRSADLVETVEIGGDQEDDRDRRDNASVDRARYAFQATGAHSVYVADLDTRDWRHDDRGDDGNGSDGPAVSVRLAGVDEAEPATSLSVEEKKVTVDGEDNGTASVTLNGSLAKVGADSEDWTWDGGDVTVEGPQGVVLESRNWEYDGGGWFGGGYETYPENFTDGEFTVTVEDDGFSLGDRETHVKFRYLVR